MTIFKLSFAILLSDWNKLLNIFRQPIVLLTKKTFFVLIILGKVLHFLNIYLIFMYFLRVLWT